MVNCRPAMILIMAPRRSNQMRPSCVFQFSPYPKYCSHFSAINVTCSLGSNFWNRTYDDIEICLDEWPCIKIAESPDRGFSTSHSLTCGMFSGRRPFLRPDSRRFACSLSQQSKQTFRPRTGGNLAVRAPAHALEYYSLTRCIGLDLRGVCAGSSATVIIVQSFLPEGLGSLRRTPDEKRDAVVEAKLASSD